MKDLFEFLMLGTILASVIIYLLVFIPIYLYELHEKYLAKQQAKEDAKRSTMPRGIALKAMGYDLPGYNDHYSIYDAKRRLK
jgi:hypothetical protein